MLQLLAQGNEAAFAILFNNNRNKIYSKAYELTESIVIAEEIVQDTFLKIWLRRETFGEVTHFKAYLFTITRNYVFSALKGITRWQNLEKMAVQDIPIFYSDTENQLVQKQYEEIYPGYNTVGRSGALGDGIVQDFEAGNLRFNVAMTNYALQIFSTQPNLLPIF